MKAILLLVCLAMVPKAIADPRILTPEEHMKLRVCVVEGMAVSVKRESSYSEYYDLMSAEIEVHGVLKGPASFEKTTFKVFYIFPKQGINHCPGFAEPSVNQRSIFYLNYGKRITKENEFTLDGYQDVEVIKDKESENTEPNK